MGDKSPKSKQKENSQKQGKANAKEQAKQKRISDKQVIRTAAPPKKK